MFSLNNKTIGYGLQITDHQAKIVKVRKSSHSNHVLQQHTVDLEKGCIKNGKILDEAAVAKRIGETVQLLDMQGAKINLSVPASNVVIRKSVFASVKDKELRNLIDVELYGGTQLPFKDPVFDFVRMGKASNEAAATSDQTVSKLDQDWVLIFATPSELVESYTSVAKQAGLNTDSVELESLSLFRLLVKDSKLTGEPMPDRFLILHAEADHADISIFENGFPVFARTVQIAAAQILDSGSSPEEIYGRHLNSELARILNYYKYSISNNQLELEKIYLSGFPVKMEAFRNLLAGSFMGPIHDLPLNKIEDTNHASYAVPLGLALKGGF